MLRYLRFGVRRVRLAAVVAVAFASGVSVASAGACPNEQLRAEDHSTSLPNCRAYELVTPPFKFGEAPSVLGVTADGSRLAFDSIGAFGEPGNDTTVFGGDYVAERGESGWSSTPVNPSATQFQGFESNEAYFTETVDFSADLSQTVFFLPPISAKPVDGRFYLRSLDGSFTEIGPAVSPEAVAAWTPSKIEGLPPNVFYRGASGDLSHLFFDLNKPLSNDWYWPGDKTIGDNRSLYEYSGTDNSEPELVGVRNNTSLVEAARSRGKAHINEAAEQVSQCGILMGGYAGGEQTTIEAYNAISVSGETVFFTGLDHSTNGNCEAEAPAVNELYARVERKQTVAISEPTTGPTGDCELCSESKPLSAVFQGASRDGSKVFFLSEQALLPGAEGDDLYEYDFNAPAANKVTLVARKLATSKGKPGGVMRVAQDGSRVYFVSEALLAGSEANEFGAVAQPGKDNLYVRDTRNAHTTFIATLAEADSEEWWVFDERPVEATPDGRFLLFPSVNDLTNESTSGVQLYRYDAQTGGLVRVSIGEGGYNNDGKSGSPYSLIESHAFAGFSLAQPHAVNISEDGSKVFFQSPLALTPQALNDVCAYEESGECQTLENNVYEYENGHVYLISDGQDTHSAYRGSSTFLIGASASGSDVFFATADPLVVQDTDTQVDVYDARVNGGFPAPVGSSSCQGEACQGARGAAPVFSVPSSATLAGGGNLAPSELPTSVKSRSLTGAQRLAKAMKACRTKRNRRKRVSCEKQAHKRYLSMFSKGHK